VSAAGQIFAPAKSAFMPSMAISRRRQAYMDVFTQHLNSIVHWLWLTILDNLGVGLVKRVTEPSTKLIVPGRYLSRNSKCNEAALGEPVVVDLTH